MIDPVFFPHDDQAVSHESKKRDFCTWHRRLVDMGAVDHRCRTDCLLDQLAREDKDFCNPRQVELGDTVTVQELIDELGWSRWKRVCDIPSTVSTVLRERIFRKQWEAKFFDDDVEV